MEQRILDEVDEIERAGGYVATIESGKLHKRITSYFTEQQRMMESGELKIVGQNVYQSELEPPPINVFRYPEGVGEQQKQRVQSLRLTRDNNKAEKALTALKEACRRKQNIVQSTIQCARVRCTEGEVFKVFKEAFGLWKLPSLW
jgi:methylmalonyl-CoA mutase N-terminal domain/subunit